MLQLSTEFYEDPEQVLGHRWMNRVTEHQDFFTRSYQLLFSNNTGDYSSWYLTWCAQFATQIFSDQIKGITHPRIYVFFLSWNMWSFDLCWWSIYQIWPMDESTFTTHGGSISKFHTHILFFICLTATQVPMLLATREHMLVIGRTCRLLWKYVNIPALWIMRHMCMCGP